MRQVLFISDLHLSEDTPKSLDQLKKLLEQPSDTTLALYILGDLFEAWLGDDIDSSWNKEIKTLFSAATFPIYLMSGNRDFLLGERFAKACQLQFIKEPYLIDLFGKKTLLLHGDSLCTDDHGHQTWRKIYKSRWFQWLAYHVPVKVRENIAQFLRNKSKQAKAIKTAEMMDVNEEEVKKIMQKYQADLLIHGHTHRPFIHALTNHKTRIVLAAWHGQGNYFVYREDASFALVYYD